MKDFEDKFDQFQEFYNKVSSAPSTLKASMHYLDSSFAQSFENMEDGRFVFTLKHYVKYIFKFVPFLPFFNQLSRHDITERLFTKFTESSLLKRVNLNPNLHLLESRRKKLARIKIEEEISLIEKYKIDEQEIIDFYHNLLQECVEKQHYFRTIIDQNAETKKDYQELEAKRDELKKNLPNLDDSDHDNDQIIKRDQVCLGNFYF